MSQDLRKPELNGMMRPTSMDIYINNTVYFKATRGNDGDKLLPLQPFTSDRELCAI